MPQTGKGPSEQAAGHLRNCKTKLRETITYTLAEWHTIGLEPMSRSALFSHTYALDDGGVESMNMDRHAMRYWIHQ